MKLVDMDCIGTQQQDSLTKSNMTRNELIETHYKKHRSEYLKYCRFRPNLNPESAEDVLQEAYSRALRYYDSFDPNKKTFEHWFFRILQNCIIDQINFDKGLNEVELDEQAEEFIECTGIDARIMRDVLARIEQKPPMHKEVLDMHFRLGYKPPDIASITELTPTNCYVIIHRFHHELRKAYGN